MDELAREWGLKYDVITAGIDEKAIRSQDPHDLVLALGRAKRDAILAKMHAQDDHRANSSTQSSAQPSVGALLITCDQVVVHQDRILEKPETADECRQFIRGYGQHPARTVGSVVCTNLSSGRSVESVDVSSIHFKPIPEHVIDKLVEEGECMWCAGGLMVEHPLVVPFVERIEGTEDGVRGLSKAQVLTLLLDAAGIA